MLCKKIRQEILTVFGFITSVTVESLFPINTNAAKSGSPYRAPISQAILLLQDNTIMESLKAKWWREKDGGGKCASAKKRRNIKLESSMKDIGGIFLVLTGGLCLSIAVAIFEFIYRLRKKSCRATQV